MSLVASPHPAEVQTVEFEVLVYVWSRVRFWIELLGMWTDLTLWTLELLTRIQLGLGGVKPALPATPN